MIKKMEVCEIVKIKNLQDEGFKDRFRCDMGEWIQYLIQNVDNKAFFMVCDIEDSVLTGYLIATHVESAIYRGVSVLYSRTAGLRKNKIALKLLAEWGRDQGARTIEIVTANPVGHTVYGFKRIGVAMELNI